MPFVAYGMIQISVKPSAALGNSSSSTLRSSASRPFLQRSFVRCTHEGLTIPASYFDSIDRIAHSDYVPSDQDILRSRAKTPWITEMTFLNHDLKYRVFDLGRSPSNRKKWVHYFDNITALIFVVPLGAYDEMLDGGRSFVSTCRYIW